MTRRARLSTCLTESLYRQKDRRPGEASRSPHDANIRRSYVAYAVSDHIDRKHQECKRSPRDGNHPERKKYVDLRFGDHEAPRRYRRLNAKAKEGKRRLQ